VADDEHGGTFGFESGCCALNAERAAIRDLLRTSGGTWKVAQIASNFTGRNTAKKPEAVSENIDRLEWFGILIHHKKSGITYWQHVEV
jgi:hypothetical protein